MSARKRAIKHAAREAAEARERLVTGKGGERKSAANAEYEGASAFYLGTGSELTSPTPNAKGCDSPAELAAAVREDTTRGRARSR